MAQIPDTKVNVCGKELVLRVNSKKPVDSPFCVGKKCYKYNVGLSLNGGRKFIPFTYHGSIHEYEDKIKETETDLVFIIYSILKDALCFIQYPDYDLFMDAFGFDWTKKESRRKGKEVFEGCKDTYLKLNLSEHTLVDMVNELTEKYEI